MSTNALSVIGAGGHAAVVGDAALLSGMLGLTFYTEDAHQVGLTLLCCPIEQLYSHKHSGNFHVAIGNSVVRSRLHRELTNSGNVAVIVAHPQAIIAGAAEIGAGSFVAAGAVVAPRSRIGYSVIINHRTIIDHDVSVGDFSHIAPGAVLGGGVRVGKHVLVGAGATVLPGLSIGDGAVIGAGAVVVADVAAGKTAIGVPARQK